MFESINLSAFADPVLDELVSGQPKLENSILLDLCANAAGPILEIGCGYGRITIPLAERGFELVGVELCGPSIAAAREKGRTLPIEWVEGDARSFQVGRQFSFVFARGGVFDFMRTRPDQEAMLARVREHLADDGIFAFDICEYQLKHMANEEDKEWFTLTDQQGRQICAGGDSRFDYDRQIWLQRGWYRLNDAKGELLAEPWELILRYNFPQAVETLLHYNGFEVIARYMDWFGTPPSFGPDWWQTVDELADEFRQHGCHVRAQGEYDAPYWFEDIDSLIFYIMSVPWPEEIRLAKHWQNINRVLESCQSERG